MSSPSLLHRLATQHFDKHYKRRVSIDIWCFSLKAVYNSCKLQRLLQAAKFVFMYSFTTLLFRPLPTEIAISINVYYQMKCFSGDSFSFF